MPINVPVQSVQPSPAKPPAAEDSGEVNAYSYGYCTWYVKTKRPDIGNHWGNASEWLASAQAAGFATGSEPRVGAIGVQGNHVTYIDGIVGPDVVLSEANYNGNWGVVTTRTVPASELFYIY